MCVKREIKNIPDYSNKKTILEIFEFYEDKVYENTKENLEYINQINPLEKKLYDSLNDNQKLEYEKLMELKELNGGITTKNSFVFAFCLAVKLFLESK